MLIIRAVSWCHEETFEPSVTSVGDVPCGMGATHQYGANRLTHEEIALHRKLFCAVAARWNAGIAMTVSAAGIVKAHRIETLRCRQGKPPAEKLLETF